MALTGLDIYKQLPKTNCKDCGQATCLAFAMALAGGKASLEACPHVSEAAKEVLDAASAPPIATVKIGKGAQEVVIGNETVLFRHDKRFEHPTGIAIEVSDNLSAEAVSAKIAAINKLVFDRVGQLHQVDLIAVCNTSGNSDKFIATVKQVMMESNFPMVLMSENPAAIAGALESCAEARPLIYAATLTNYQAMTALAKQYQVPLAVRGESLEQLAELVEKIIALGFKELVIDSGEQEVAQKLADLTQIRRKAIKERFRAFGFPAMAVASNNDVVKEAVDAGIYLSKYASIVVIRSADPAVILPLITLRLNIYTDPQKPIAVEAKVYKIGNTGPDSPVFITTNFSLTYFCVAGDVESSRVPAYVIPIDTDGTSVLTAWSAGKFTPEKITADLEALGIKELVNHNKIIIPGHVAVLSGKLQDLSGFEVLVGPRESSGIPSFIKQRWNA